MATAVEQDSESTTRHDFDLTAGFDEFAGDLFWLGVIESFELAGEPSVATVGDHRQRDVQIDIQTDFAGKIVHVKEVDVGAQPVFDSVAPGIIHDQFTR